MASAWDHWLKWLQMHELDVIREDADVVSPKSSLDIIRLLEPELSFKGVVVKACVEDMLQDLNAFAKSSLLDEDQKVGIRFGFLGCSCCS